MTNALPAEAGATLTGEPANVRLLIRQLACVIDPAVRFIDDEPVPHRWAEELAARHIGETLAVGLRIAAESADDSPMLPCLMWSAATRRAADEVQAWTRTLVS